jgi:repressor LexA
MSIGDNIKAIRAARGLTQEEFGAAIGVSGMAVSQWECGRSVPRMGAVQAIADRFGVTRSDVVGESAPRLSQEPSPRRASMPLLGRVHAGDAQEPEVLEDAVPVPWSVARNHPHGYFLEVEGDCMSRVYPAGSLILIDPDRPPQTGSVAVVSIDGEAFVMRRLYRGASTLVLSPDSYADGYEDIVIGRDEGRTVEFVGTVVWYQPARELQ